MPVGACWARSEVAAAFVPGDHGSTFGGQPLAMSAARATLAVMEAEDVPGRARELGARLKSALEAFPGVASVRGQGLLLAAVLTDEVAGRVCGESLQAGLVINAPRSDVLRLAPPLLVSPAEVGEALTILEPIVARATGTGTGGGG